MYEDVNSYLSYVRIYLKSNSSECEGSSPGSQASVVSPFNTELETKSCAVEAISNASVPKHAFQAFQFLSASSEAQVNGDVLLPNDITTA